MVILSRLIYLGKAAAKRGISFVSRVKKTCLKAIQKIKAQASLLAKSEGSCDDLLVLVDRRTPLPKHYVPRDLVSLRSYGISTLWSDILLRREAAEHLSWLVAAATEAGEELAVLSAYRSFEDQRRIFADVGTVYGEDAGRWCARPGHSQHQLGTTVDFTNGATDYTLGWSFAETSAGRWLLEHADEYGFVLAYPKGKETETGYQWEPWHYRYIGVENARRLRSSGLSLQAFLLREGVLPTTIDQEQIPKLHGRP